MVVTTTKLIINNKLTNINKIVVQFTSFFIGTQLRLRNIMLCNRNCD